MSETVGSRSERKHAAIRTAARATFLRDGFAGTSMDTVAAESGVSKQTVYAHFGSKENLYVRVVAELTQEIARELPEPPGNDLDRAGVAAWLLDYGTRQLRAVLAPEVLQLRRLVIAEAERFPGIAKAFHDHGAQRSIDLLRTAFAAFAASGLLRVDDPRAAATDFNWLLMGDPVNRAMMLGATPGPKRVRQHAEHAVTIFLAAYG